MSIWESHWLSLRESKLFDPLFLDYTGQQEGMRKFYSYSPDEEGIKEFIGEYAQYPCNRRVLVNELLRQNSGIALSPASLSNIERLKSGNVYTVATGHQLCLFTGPLYFVYKMLSVINYCEYLNIRMPGKHFVPVYWMASEDHDIAEINHFNLFGKKLEWNTTEKGRAGELSTNGLEFVVEAFATIAGDSENARKLSDLFKRAYLQHQNMADATRYLVNELFGSYGLIILDANVKELKEIFTGEIKQDIFENKAWKEVSKTISELEAEKYKVQVNPREINCFYALPGLRERIEKQGDVYKVLNTGIAFTAGELEKEIEQYPERFSPNVVLRPLYQQKLLPNVAYVGGPGELAYWLEYYAMFKAFGLPFPVLLPRNFVMCLDEHVVNKLEKMNIPLDKLVFDSEFLIKTYLLKGDIPVAELVGEKQDIEKVFTGLKEKAANIDKSLANAIDAEKQRTLNSIVGLEQKIVRALKTKKESEINQLRKLKDKLFPGQVPQERVDNFAAFFLYEDSFITTIKEALTPTGMRFGFTILYRRK